MVGAVRPVSDSVERERKCETAYLFEEGLAQVSMIKNVKRKIKKSDIFTFFNKF